MRIIGSPFTPIIPGADALRLSLGRKRIRSRIYFDDRGTGRTGRHRSGSRAPPLPHRVAVQTTLIADYWQTPLTSSALPVDEFEFLTAFT